MMSSAYIQSIGERFMKKLFINFTWFIFCLMFIFGCADNVIDDDLQKVKITAWMPLEPWSINAFTNRNFGENEIIKEIEKKFNVEFVFTHPTTGSEAELFGLMTLDKVLPDLIFSPNWYAGGIEQGIKDGLYKDITNVVEEKMPNYYSVITADDDINRLALTDTKKIGAIYGLTTYEEYPFYGPIFKQKWLTDVEEEVPVTIADWERVLTKFKNQKGAVAPFILDPTGYDYTGGTFLSAYGVAPAFYLKEDTIKYGPMEDGFYQYLNLMRDWIKKGLISSNFAEKDWNGILDQIKSNQSGVLMQSPDTMSVHFENAGISWTHAPYPVLNEGDELSYRQKSFKVFDGWGTSVAISTSCKNVDRVLSVLDYGYSQEGSNLYNFGIEGRTHTVNSETNKKEFTDIIYNNPYGFSPLQALWRYKVHNGLFIRDEHNANPILIRNQKSVNARQSWAQISSSSVIPPLSYTREESHSIGLKMDKINSYISTQVLSFLTGVQNDFSAGDVITNPIVFKSKIENEKINDVLAIVQAAYVRYQQRT